MSFTTPLAIRSCAFATTVFSRFDGVVGLDLGRRAAQQALATDAHGHALPAR